MASKRSGKPRKPASRSTGVMTKVASAKRGQKPRADAFRAKLVELAMKEFAQIVARAPDSVVADALSQPTAFASLATTVAGSVYDESGITDDDRVIMAARAAGAQYKVDLLKRAGGAYSGPQLAEALGRTRQAVHEGRSRNRYFAVPTADGVVYPKLQLTKDGLLPGLRDFLEAFEVADPWTQLMVLIEPSDRLGGKSPLAALRSGNREGAMEVARAYGEHGA